MVEKEEEKKEEKVEEKEEKKEFALVEVPTEMGVAIKTPEGNIVSESQLLVLIANKLEELKKGIVG